MGQDIRWRVRGIPLSAFNETGSVGEPFAVLQNKQGKTVVLTKEPYYNEEDKEKSSTKEENTLRSY